jgi:hypothetical protein
MHGYMIIFRKMTPVKANAETLTKPNPLQNKNSKFSYDKNSKKLATPLVKKNTNTYL